MFSREFQRRKLMTIVRASGGRQRSVADRVVTGISRRVIGFRNRADFAVAFEIQTKLETARMKGAAPIEIARRLEIVPLDRHAH